MARAPAGRLSRAPSGGVRASGPRPGFPGPARRPDGHGRGADRSAERPAAQARARPRSAGCAPERAGGRRRSRRARSPRALQPGSPRPAVSRGAGWTTSRPGRPGRRAGGRWHPAHRQPPASGGPLFPDGADAWTGAHARRPRSTARLSMARGLVRSQSRRTSWRAIERRTRRLRLEAPQRAPDRLVERLLLAVGNTGGRRCARPPVRGHLHQRSRRRARRASISSARLSLCPLISKTLLPFLSRNQICGTLTTPALAAYPSSSRTWKS